MTRWYALAETDDAFLETAPVRSVQIVDVPVPPERLWDVLTADDAVVSWSPLFTNVEWSARPFGVGTVRTVTLARAIKVRERFYRWDDGTRKTFSVVESTAPGLKRMAEDYVVAATDEGARLTWTIAMEPAHLVRPTAMLAAPGVNLAFGSAARGLRARVVGGGSQRPAA